MKITIIGAPESFGCDRMGTELAPDVLREKGIKRVLESHGHSVDDWGNIPVPEGDRRVKFADHRQVKYLGQVVESCANLSQTVGRAMEQGSFPIVIGGDHAVALGSISALGSVSALKGDYMGGDAMEDGSGEEIRGGAQKNGSLGVVWIDAHGDINTPSSSPSKNAHGMPMASLMGYGDREMVDLYRPGAKINPRNVWWVGVRSLDEGEMELIDLLDLSVYSMDKIRRQGMEQVVGKLKNQIRGAGVSRLHISLDVDSLDPLIAPGTGTPVDGGLALEELLMVLDTLLDTGMVRSMDLVELNPALDDPDGRTVEVCVKIIDFVARKLK